MRKFIILLILTTTACIANAQNVGIGTTGPEQKLDVVGTIGMRNAASYDHIYFTHITGTAAVNVGGANAGFAIRVGNGSSGSYGGQPYTEALRILPNGNSGFGTTNPQLKLEVVGNIGMRNGATYDHIYFTHVTGTAAINAGGADAGLALRVGNGNTGTFGEQIYTEGLRILPSGNVGIGTTSPVSKLHVNGSFRLGTSSTVLNSMGQYTTSFTGANMPANSSLPFTFNGVGQPANAAILFNPDIDLPDGIILSYVKGGAAGVVTGKLYNTKSIDVAVPGFNVTFTWVK